MWPTPTDPPCTEADWPRLQAGAVDQPLPRGDETKWQGSRLADRDIRRFEREQIGIDRREFRERTLLATGTPGHSINLVTTAEARNVPGCRLNSPGEIEAQNGWQRMARMRGGASADLDVE